MTEHLFLDYVRDRIESVPAARSFIQHETGDALAYGELWPRIRGVAGELEAAGIPPGASFLLPMENTPDSVTLFLGALCAGRVPVLVSPRSPEGYLADVARIAATTTLVRSSRAQLPATPASLRVLTLACEPAAREPDWPARGARDTAYILFTSGSTGAPKGIQTPYAGVVSKLAGMHAGYRLTERDRHLSVLPTSHVSGLYHNVLLAFQAGAGIYMRTSFVRDDFFDVIARERIGFVQIVPTLIASLLASDVRAPPSIHEHLVQIGSGSAFLPARQLVAFEERFGVRIVQCYGMTETACAITLCNPTDGKRRPDSVGRPLPGNEITIWENGAPVPVGQVGDVMVRGENVLTGYAGDASTPPFTREWLRTGDRGRLDDEGYLRLEGRSDDMIKRGAHLIYPKEIEDVVLACVPGIVEVAAFGVPHDTLGHDLVCCVSFGSSPPLSSREMIRRVRDRLPPERVPSQISVVDALPRIRGVKLDRRALQALHEERRRAQASGRGGGPAP